MTERLTETFIRALKPPARGSRQDSGCRVDRLHHQHLRLNQGTSPGRADLRAVELAQWYGDFIDSQVRALAKLDDDFAINADGEDATISGKLEVEIMRLASDGGDQFRLRFKFPSEPLDVRIRRVQLLEQLGVKDGGS